MNQPLIFKTESGRQAILQGYDSFLAHWPVPWEGIEVQTGYGKTFVLSCGPAGAPALVLIHGSAANSAMWAGDIAAYAACYRVYVVDIPGEPGKSEPVRWSLDTTAPSEWLEQVFTGLSLERASLLGISLGGFMAASFATACPGRVEKLVLLCPAGIGKQKMSFLFKAIVYSMLGDWGYQRISRMVNGQVAIHKDALAYMRLISKQFSPRMEMIPVLTDEALQRLSMPVLLMAGEKDDLIDSKSTVERVTRLVPGADVRLLPNAPHALIDQAGEVLPFLQNCF
jgi:pimeloyl-ACP methyl ester carboxylesterase